MSLKLELSQLLTFHNQLNIIQETADQTIKDFDAFGYEIIFSGKEESAYEELFKQLSPLIESLINNNYKKLMNVLYRIDVAEDVINQELKNNNPSEFAAIITKIVLERELKKVVTRNYYKHQQKES
ncbi:MAG: hypothetical protein HOB26_04315 [Flavobacteriales bacterium]|jgi:hypothetical protein|nr:hypothetical protein [Flavobacteriales bacterium]MBT6745757.1 hypothetical protein [Flavobacteriales bacterium]